MNMATVTCDLCLCLCLCACVCGLGVVHIVMQSGPTHSTAKPAHHHDDENQDLISQVPQVEVAFKWDPVED